MSVVDCRFTGVGCRLSAYRCLLTGVSFPSSHRHPERSEGSR